MLRSRFLSSSGIIAGLFANRIPLRFQSSGAPPPENDAEFGRINKNMIWGLWNEGNLFSLSVAELSAFLTQHCNVEIDPKAKKSALVRQVEEIMSAEQPNLTVPQEGLGDAAGGSGTAAFTITDTEKGADIFEESDFYGDWGAESGYEDRRDVDFMELSPSKMGAHFEALPPRAFQLLHESVTADVSLTTFNPSKLPGQKSRTSALVASSISPNEANKIRFRRGLQWCLLNLWNMNMSGELNIGGGKVLYWRDIAKHNRNILPLWTVQSHLYNSHPYVWFAVAHPSNTAAMEAFANNLGMSLSQEPTTSYKLSIRKGKEQLDCELNSLLRCTLLNKPWDRFLMTHMIRNQMPDLRYLVRARHSVRKRIADMYLDADILRSTRDSVQSVLSPELGEVVYCCERVVRKWSMPILETPAGSQESRNTGLQLQLVETKRTPLIVTKVGDEGTRMEYELIVKLPQQSEGVDTVQLADNLWEYGNAFAEALQPGMADMHAYTMPSSAAFEPLSRT